MKKYWKTILISFVIVTTISSYYIQAARAIKNDISFKIETTSGNKEEIENLTLQASYSGDYFHRWLYISKDGSTDVSRESFIGNLGASYVPLTFQKYIKEHRNFMRGKDRDPREYFEDEARLIYTTVPGDGWKVTEGDLLTLQIDILDKNTNDSSSFEINTPAQANYDWVNVNDVYVEEGKIKILAAGSLVNGGAELHIYTVDENSKELEQDSIIAKTEPEEGIESYIRIFNDGFKIQNDNYYLYKVEKSKNRMGDAESEIISSQMYLYNNSTNEVEKLEISDKLKPNMDRGVLHGADVFIPVYSAKDLELNRYNIEKKQWEESLHFNFPSTANDEGEPILQITDDKLYFVNRVSDSRSFFIGDLRTGESLYEGKIIGGNRENLNTNYSLNIEQFYSTK